MKSIINWMAAVLLLLSAIVFNSCNVDGSGDTGGAGMSGYVSVTYYANGGTEGTVPADDTVYSLGDEVTVMDNAGNLVGEEVGGDHAGSGIKQCFIGWNTDSDAVTAEYAADDTFTITEDTNLYAIYTIGDDVLRKIGPAGGYVFYDAGSTQSWGRYLEVWTEDESGTYQWKTSTSATSGTSTAIGTGYENTYTDMSGTQHPAAETVRGATYGGYNDWFVPSRSELIEIWDTIADDGAGNNSGFGGFAAEPYWSSSESSTITTTSAWIITFASGNPGTKFKTNDERVRAVRNF